MSRPRHTNQLAMMLRKRNMSHSDLASYAGLTRQAVGHYIHGRRTPTMRTARAIADALGITIERLCKEFDLS